MYSRILVPIDGSEHAHRGLEVACVLAEHYKSKVILLCVTDKELSEGVAEAAINEGIVRPSSYQDFISTLDYPSIAMSQAKQNRQAMLFRAASAISDKIVERGARFATGQHVAEVLTLIRSGAPDDHVVAVAKEYDADLIVIGSRGKGGLDALLHPSVAKSVRKRAACPCLVLFPSKDDRS